MSSKKGKIEQQATEALLSTADSVLDVIGARKKPEPAVATVSLVEPYTPSRSSVSSSYSWGAPVHKPVDPEVWNGPCAHCGERLRDGKEPTLLLSDEDWNEVHGVAHMECDTEEFLRWGRESGEFERRRKLRESRAREKSETAESREARDLEKARQEARREIKREKVERLAKQLGVDPAGKTLKDLRKIKREQDKALKKTKSEIVKKLVGDSPSEGDDDVWIVD